MRWLFALTLLFSTYSSAYDGFKVGADNSKWLTWYGGVAVYQDGQSKIKCTFVKKISSVDAQGNAYEGTSFTCKKDLFVMVKQYLDTPDVLLILVDPDKFEERKTYLADLFITYDKEKDK